MIRRHTAILFILGLFVIAVCSLDSSGGTDITASYVSCRLMLMGESAHLYSYDPSFFNVVSDPAWLNIGKAGHIGSQVLIVPFVQTPLWPYVLQPLCDEMSFPAFHRAFELVVALCFAAMIWLVGRYWAPRFFTPLWVSIVALIWIKADPLRDAIELTNTHAIFLLLTLLAILCGRSNRTFVAGACLAMAAAVKITPAVFVIYWLITKQRRAAMSFVIASVGLFALAVAACGRSVMLDYIHSMSRVSHILLLSEGNQSVVAWWMETMQRSPVTLGFRSLPMPSSMSLVSSGLVLLSAIVGGYCDLRGSQQDSKLPPYGAIVTFLGATIFSPIAWSHYYILLVIPMILLFEEYLKHRSKLLMSLIVGMLFLANTKVLLRQLQYLHIAVSPIESGQFYAGLIAIGGMVLLCKRRMEEPYIHGTKAVGLRPSESTIPV